jgi:lipoprotein-releasing system permease protein
MLSRKKQTLLILLGIIIGIAAYVILTGIMFGFQEYITDQLINNNFHIDISAREEYLKTNDLDTVFFKPSILVNWLRPPSGRRDSLRIENPTGWYQTLSQDNRVLAYASQLQIQAIARNGKATQTIQLIGCRPEDQIKVTNIANYMTEGNFTDIAQGGNRLLVGKKLLAILGANPSDNILISSAKGKIIPFKVVGTFELGIRSADESRGYALLEDVQKLNQTPGYISDIMVRLQDVSQAKTIADAWMTWSPDKILSWDEAFANILSVFKFQDFIRNFMSLSILLVAGFGIYNILNILISQKRSEIAILRAMGFDRGDIVRLFMFQGLILGFVGGCVGLLLGYLVCSYMSTLPAIGGRMGGPGQHMLISYNIIIYIHAFLLAVGVSFFSSILPSWYAGKLSPIDIIRSEARG